MVPGAASHPRRDAKLRHTTGSTRAAGPRPTHWRATLLPAVSIPEPACAPNMLTQLKEADAKQTGVLKNTTPRYMHRSAQSPWQHRAPRSVCVRYLWCSDLETTRKHTGSGRRNVVSISSSSAASTSPAARWYSSYPNVPSSRPLRARSTEPSGRLTVGPGRPSCQVATGSATSGSLAAWSSGRRPPPGRGAGAGAGAVSGQGLVSGSGYLGGNRPPSSLSSRPTPSPRVPELSKVLSTPLSRTARAEEPLTCVEFYLGT